MAHYPHIKSFKKNEKEKTETSEIPDKRLKPFCGDFVRNCLQRHWSKSRVDLGTFAYEERLKELESFLEKAQ